MVVSRGGKALAVLCVADGHGGSEYRRSDIGARCAVKQAQAAAGKRGDSPSSGWQQLDGAGPVQATPHSTAAETPREPVAGSLSMNTPPTIPFRRTSGPRNQILRWTRLYGATVLAALLTPEFHLYIQLGDGDILTISADGGSYPTGPSRLTATCSQITLPRCVRKRRGVSCASIFSR